MKKCFKCEQNKPLTEFYRHAQMSDGHLSKCKDCTRKDVTENRNKNRDYYLWFDRLRAKSPKRQTARKMYTAANKQKHALASAAWSQRNKDKKAAAVAINNAVRDGRLVKLPCEVCGTNERVQGHHFDYSRPLDVVWLCSGHHAAYHVVERRIAELKRKGEQVAA